MAHTINVRNWEWGVGDGAGGFIEVFVVSVCSREILLSQELEGVVGSLWAQRRELGIGVP